MQASAAVSSEQRPRLIHIANGEKLLGNRKMSDVSLSKEESGIIKNLLSNLMKKV